MDAVKPVSLYVVPGAMEAIWAKLAQAAPWQRSIRYAVTPTLSVDAAQLKLICDVEVAVAPSVDGAVGGVVSGVLAVAVPE